ncbi:MAG: ribulokinase [Verrucomicrobiota bacterium]|nr:ribulokinase [Verrucomicrobiota bacterium]
MKMYALGIDFGTLSGRALLVDADTGQEIADAVHPYANAVIEKCVPGTKTPLEPDTALQDPKDYLDVLRIAVPAVLAKAKVKPAQIIGIGTDFTASSPLPCFSDGTPVCFDPKLRNNPHSWVKLWKHHAAQPEADYINEIARQRGEHFATVYGGKYSSEWFFSKLLQVVHDAPEVYDAMDRWIEAADWIVWQLTGQEKRSVCAAGYKAMWVYPYGEGWAYPSPEFFRALHPKLETVYGKLSMELHQLGARAGGLTAEMAKLMGLNPGTPVAIGNVDAHAAVPACTVTSPGKLVNIMGTSTCSMVLGNGFQPVEGMCGAVANGIIPGLWGFEAGQSCVGDSFGWFVQNACPRHALGLPENADEGSVHARLVELASASKPGRSGLLALDWWNGNRSVLVDTTLSGCIFGLNLATTPAEIYRAMIESTAFGQLRIIQSFEEHGVPIDEVFACGGLAIKNDFLMQIYADVINRPISIADSKQTCALGAAMHGAVAAGYHANISVAAAKMARVREKRFEPIGANTSIYNQLYSEYCRLHDLLGRHQIPTMRTLKKLRAV